jgi:glutamate/tyrosine decarboxylase-like PLP-dependent enzyme
LDAGEGGEAVVVELLEGGQVAGDGAQEVVGVAEEALSLQDVGDVGDGLFEGRDGVAVSVAHGDEDEGFEGEAEGVGVEVCAVAADRAGAFEGTQASVAGRDAEADPLGELGDGERADAPNLPAMDARLLRRTADLAAEYLGSVPERPVRPEASLEQLRAGLRVELGDEPLPATQVIEELVAGVDPGLVDVQSPRYYGFVVGGGLDAAIAADWLTSTWDQNGVGYPVGPSASVVEEVVCEWLLDVLGLPADAGIGLTTGCQMAHFTCLAAARHRVLADVGWDVERDGLFGAPPIRVLLGAKARTTVFAALRMLGLGAARVEPVPADDQGRMQVAELAKALEAGGGPAIVVAQVGEVNTGAIDDMPRVVELAREHGAWCHVDGAFGLWAAASPALRNLVEGVADADSWATDCHKQLNVPHDCGLAIVRDRAAHAATMNSFAGVEYVTQPEHDERYQSEWVPEFSRRARGFPVYAALRQLGRRGLAELVERCCAHARLIADLLAAEDGVTVLNDVVLNQALVRFEVDGTNVTDDVIARVQREGTCWMSGTEWDGEPAMRISVCNWRTTEQDIRRSARAILAQMPVTAQPACSSSLLSFST